MKWGTFGYDSSGGLKSSTLLFYGDLKVAATYLMNREITSENVVPVPRTGNDIWTDWESVPTILFAQDVGLVPRTSFLGLMRASATTLGGWNVG